MLVQRTPYGETSLVVHVLTPHHGRVHLIAKGAHRPKSRFSGVLDWFDTLELGWSTHTSSELGTLRTGELTVRRRRLTLDLDVYRSAQTTLELLDLSSRAGVADGALYALGAAALDALNDAEPAAATALLAAFELQLLMELGIMPALGECAVCGQAAPPVGRGGPTPRVPFSAQVGGRLCAKHANEAHATGVRVGTLPEGVLGAAHRAAMTPLEILAAEPPWPLALAERVLDFAGRFLDHHLESRPRSQSRFLDAPDRNRRALDGTPFAPSTRTGTP